jgi:hypothetical protein
LDPVSLIVTALATGAAAILSDSTASATRKAYGELKRRMLSRLVGRTAAQSALEHVGESAAWRDVLTDAVAATDMGSDEVVLEAARRVMALVDPAGSSAGKYVVDSRTAQGVQVGDGNVQINTFGRRPGDIRE